MNLQLDQSLAQQYENSSKKMQKITQMWITQNLPCLYCGKSYLIKAETNCQQADFACPSCSEIYVLKYRNSPISDRLPIGAYQPMIQKVESLKNPNFLFLQYDRKELRIQNLFLIPRYFFCADTIERCQPLSNPTRRRGWVGCNILLNRVPAEGYIYVVENGTEYVMQEVLQNRKQTNFMRAYKPRAREWMIDMLNLIQDKEFTVEEMCAYAPIMEIRYAGITDAELRIKKVLQILRDNGIIVFIGNGKYAKTKKLV